MNLSAGTKLGPYEIVAPLGAGGMGEVYRARDSKLTRDVAIEVLWPAYDISPDGQRFLMMKSDAAATSIVVVQDWSEELKMRVPVN